MGHQRSHSRRQPLRPPSRGVRLCQTESSLSSTSTTITCTEAYYNVRPMPRQLRSPCCSIMPILSQREAAALRGKRADRDIALQSSVKVGSARATSHGAARKFPEEMP